MQQIVTDTALLSDPSSHKPDKNVSALIRATERSRLQNCLRTVEWARRIDVNVVDHRDQPFGS